MTSAHMTVTGDYPEPPGWQTDPDGEPPTTDGEWDSPRKVTLVSAADIPVRRARWLWEDRLPLGSLCLLAGREGLGKSTVAFNLGARLTRGVLPGEFYGQPRPVFVVATEDSWPHTIADDGSRATESRRSPKSTLAERELHHYYDI